MVMILIRMATILMVTLCKIRWLSGLWPDLVTSDWLFLRAIARYDSQSRAASVATISRPQFRTLVQYSG